MVQSKQEKHTDQGDEIDLRTLLKTFIARRFYIAGLTGFVTILAVLYALSLTTTYIVSSSFISPSQISINTINESDLSPETRKTVLGKFLNQLSSREIQLKVFSDGGYNYALKYDDEQVDGDLDYSSAFLRSLRIVPLGKKILEGEIENLLENSYLISLEGKNPKIISKYLNELTSYANIETINDLNSTATQVLSMLIIKAIKERTLLIEQAKINRLLLIKRIKEEEKQKISEINNQIESLKLQTYQERLMLIERIKEEDGLKIKEIQNQIDRIIFKEKESQLIQIKKLTSEAKLARVLGIKENNLKQLNYGIKANSSINIAINPEDTLPDWYVYGEKALLAKIEELQKRSVEDVSLNEIIDLKNQLSEVKNNVRLEALENRIDDSAFTPEIVALKMTLKKIKLNVILNTLEAREDDSPFIDGIAELNIKINKLESVKINLVDISSMQIRRPASSQTAKAIKSNKRMIVLLAFFGSFMMSLLLVLILSAFKPDEKTPA